MRRSRRRKDDWTRVRFGDVAHNSTTVSRDPAGEGFTRYIIGKHIDENRLRVESWGDVGDPDFGPRIRTIFLPGDVICTTRGPKLKVATVDFRGLGAHTNFVLRTRDPEVLLQPYLEAIVRSDSFQQHLAKHFRGSVNLFVNWSDAALYELGLPPVDEQAKVCRVLAQIGNVRAHADVAKQASVACVRSYLNALFRDMAQSQRWPVVDLAAVADIRTGIARHAAKESAAGLAVPYITVAHVQDGFINLSDRRTMKIAPDLLPRYALHDGDVLMTEGGDLDKLGRGTVWKDVGEPYVHQNHVFAVRPDKTRLRSEWLAAAARSAVGREYFLMCAKRTSNLASINKSQVSAFRLPLPPLGLQDDLLASLDSLLSASEELLHRESAARRLTSQIYESFSEGFEW